MTQRILHTKSFFILAAIAGLLLIQARTPAEPVIGKQDALVAKLVCYDLQKGHLKQPQLGEEASQQLCHRFLKDIDPAKIYFTKDDVEELEKDAAQLTDKLLKGDLSFAYKVYERFAARLGERVKLVEELVKAPQDFTVKEYLDTDYDKTDFTSSQDELRDRWRKRIKYDLLLQRLGQKTLPEGDAKQKSVTQKPLPEAEAKQKVLTRYRDFQKRWKQLDNYDLMELYLTSLTTCLDPHSSYMSPTTLADFDIAMRLNLDGIGALLRVENGTTMVAEIVPGGAAAKDGKLKPNDKIIAVAQGDDKFVDVLDWKITEVVKLIRGARGTRVQLKVIPAGKAEPVIYALTRQKIELKAQEARPEIVDQGKKADGKPYRIGIIDLPSFYVDPTARGKDGGKSATADVRKILQDFNAKGVDGVVLDLRHNGGGALSEALSLTGLFIDHGPVVQVKNSHGRVQQGNDPEKGTVYSGPLMVLVSRLSASASEILAGALQDYGRALIVGDTTTHGKGTVQQLIDLGDQVQEENPPKLGALKLTIQQFYRVNGDSTQDRGVSSDVAVPSLTEVLATGEKDLEHALKFDHVPSVEHEDMGLVTPDVKDTLKARSAQRVKNSKEFAKFVKELDQLKARKARKKVPLNEKEMKDQFTDEDAKKTDNLNIDGDPDDPAPPPKSDTTYKFKRTFLNNEFLQIMEDFIQGKKLLSAR
ncbi:MAG TPA: carboxy terminal-processing peptidase [Gemmataceae bacterium]|jgi:carboxyl-terminal processing protease|nr:carboxy terminal-processing peptidase [Gemmataceae bacterium]